MFPNKFVNRLKGADKGPAAIIEASVNMKLYDIETDSEVYQQGIFTETPMDFFEALGFKHYKGSPGC